MWKPVLPLVLALGMCGCQEQDGSSPDLPAGWEDAQRIQHYVSPWLDDHSVDAGVSVDAGAAATNGGVSVALALPRFSGQFRYAAMAA